MQNYLTIQVLENNKWRTLENVAAPIYTNKTLDLSLDTAKIILPLQRNEKLIEPMSIIRFIRRDLKTEAQEIEYYVAYSTVADRMSTMQPYVEKHTIALVELTKLLEGKVCDNLTFTNPIVKDYSQLKKDAASHYSDGTAKEKTHFEVYEPDAPRAFYNPGIITLRTPRHVVYVYPEHGGDESTGLRGSNPTVTITAPNGQVTVLKFYYSMGLDYEDLPADQYYNATQTGAYVIDYTVTIKDKDHPSSPGLDIKLHFYVTVADESQTPKPYTMKSVLERLLLVWDSPETGSAAKYKLSNELDFLANIPAPEFSMTRGTLFDNLLTVAGHINAIPRLTVDPLTIAPVENGATATEKFNVITFDLLSRDNVYPYPIAGYTQRSEIYNGDEAFSALDGFIQNMSFSKDNGYGTVVDPYPTGGKTTRSDSLLIDANTAVIKTSMPLNRLRKVEYIVNPATNESVDITTYCFEAAKYRTLSNFDNGILFSKQYAIQWTQGTDIIDGLTFTAESVFPIGKEHAIVNVLELCGVPKAQQSPIEQMVFRVTYDPYVTARLTQRKPVYLGNEMTKIYNQGNYLVESEYVGQNMRGVVARLGNKVVEETHFFKIGKEPKCGDLFNGMYIAAIQTAYQNNYIKATLTMTKDFNMLSQYLALDSYYRLYDVSEKQSTERGITINSSIFVAGEPANEITEVPNNAHSLPADMPALTRRQLLHSTDTKRQEASLAYFQMYGAPGEVIGQYLLPVSAFSFGNSVAFACQFADNFSAGDQSEDVIISKVHRRVNQPVPYANDFGNITRMIIEWLYGTNSPLSMDQANALPEYNNVNLNNLLIFEAIEVQKDSREKLNISRQIHYQGLDDSVIIGTQLTEINPLIMDVFTEATPKFYWLKRPLNQFRWSVDLTDAQEGALPNYRNSIGPQRATEFYATAPAGEWTGCAFVDPKENRLYVGINKQISGGETATITFFF